MTLYPDGYGTELVTLEAMRNRHGPKMHPEFARRFFAYIDYKAGLLGVGGGWRSTQPVKPGFAPPGKSFHESQTFASGQSCYAAVDLVCPVPGGVHRSPMWAETDDAGLYGLHTFIDGEPWHIQCLEMRGYDSWVNAGRPDPPVFPLPATTPTSGVVDMYVIAVSRNGWPGPVDLVVSAEATRWNQNGNTSSLDKLAGVPRLQVDKNQALGVLIDRPGQGPCPFEVLPDYFDADLAAAW